MAFSALGISSSSSYPGISLPLRASGRRRLQPTTSRGIYCWPSSSPLGKYANFIVPRALLMKPIGIDVFGDGDV